MFIKFIHNAEVLFLGKDILLIEILFMFVTCMMSKNRQISKSTLCHLIKCGLPLLFRRYLNSYLGRIKTENLDLYCLLYNNLDKNNNFLVSKEFVALFLKNLKIKH
jgi:hypothetical protein